MHVNSQCMVYALCAMRCGQRFGDEIGSFQEMDYRNTGCITRKNFQTLLEHWGNRMSSADMDWLLETFADEVRFSSSFHAPIPGIDPQTF